MKDYQKNFALCIDNEGYEASLISHKIYEIVPDVRAEEDDLIRIIDESGEDYLYHKSHFVITVLPEKLIDSSSFPMASAIIPKYLSFNIIF